MNADGIEYLGVDGQLLSYNLFAYCGNNPMIGYDPSGHFSWGKLAAIVVVSAVIAVSVFATVATFGAASVAGTIAITSTIAIAAKATEIAVLQGKKSTQDGDGVLDIIDDIVNSEFNNSGKIIGVTPISKTAGFASGFYSQSSSFQDSIELMKIDGSFKGLPGSAVGAVIERFKNAKDYLSMTTSKTSFVTSYGFAAINVVKMINSCFTSDPIKRATKRGYSLQ